MKTFIILGLILTTVNSSFLRELNSEANTPTALTVSAVTFVADCSVDSEVTITATTGQTDYETVQGTTTITGKLSSGVTANDISLTGGIATKKTTDSAADGKIEFKFTPAGTQKTGLYKLASITATGATVTIADTITNALTISTAATHDATQEGTQEIEEGQTFEVKFEKALAKVPLIYASSTAETPIAECSQDTTDNKKVLCKTKAGEMDSETEYTIHYKNGCTATLTPTKVKVKFTTPEDSSAFVTFGKIALLAVALLF